MLLIFIVAFLFVGSIDGLDDGYALTPPMGFNTYNAFYRTYTELDLYDNIDLLDSLGLKDLGYIFFNVDGVWWNGDYENGIVYRNESGHWVEPTDKFPSGVRPLADYIHSKGMKFGWYTSGRVTACCCVSKKMEPMSQGYEDQDFARLIEWGVDFFKIDNCGVNNGVSRKGIMQRWYNRIKETGIVLENSRFDCQAAKYSNGDLKPASQQSIPSWCDDYAHLWRVSKDIGFYIDDIRFTSWESIIFNVRALRGLEHRSGPGHWNHPDMLDVGNGDLTLDENRAHFAMWCINSAPLILGTDLRDISQQHLDIISNAHAIRVDQTYYDDAGSYYSTIDSVDLWTKRLPNNELAVLGVNLDDNDEKDFSFYFSYQYRTRTMIKHLIDWDTSDTVQQNLNCTFFNIWTEEYSNQQDMITVTLRPHESSFWIISNCTQGEGTQFPTRTPTKYPSVAPTTNFPTMSPTNFPTKYPTTSFPTRSPTTSFPTPN